MITRYDFEYASLIESIYRDLYECNLLLETVHPIDIINNKEEVLSEAFLNFSRITNTISKISENIMKLFKKFKDMTVKLDKRNDKIIQDFSKIDVNKLKLDDFQYEIFPYWEGYRNISSFDFPKFDENNLSQYTINNGLEFKERMRNVFTKDESGNIIVNQSYFRGSDKKIIVTKSNAAQVFNNCISICKTRKNITEKINSQISQYMASVSRYANSNTTNQNDNADQNKTLPESIVFNNSIYKDEYFDILLEDITTTNDIEKEEKNPYINNNSNQSNKINDTKQIIDAAISYTRICGEITTKMFTILDEAYDNSLKFCNKISTMS